MACTECDPDYHESWCHYDMDCCGCTCRDAYTEYAHEKRHRSERRFPASFTRLTDESAGGDFTYG